MDKVNLHMHRVCRERLLYDLQNKLLFRIIKFKETTFPFSAAEAISVIYIGFSYPTEKGEKKN